MVHFPDNNGRGLRGLRARAQGAVARPAPADRGQPPQQLQRARGRASGKSAAERRDEGSR
ncbi:TPA: hypothetical protein ACH3X3_015183 [Trebouxia sp. C0006]